MTHTAPDRSFGANASADPRDKAGPFPSRGPGLTGCPCLSYNVPTGTEPPHHNHLPPGRHAAAMETQPPAPGPATISGRPRRRAVEACTFCRRRKVQPYPETPNPLDSPAANSPLQIKCNGEKPTCANCKIYGKECTFEPLGDSSRADRASPATARRSYHSRAKTAGSLRRQSHPAQARGNEQCNGNGGGGEDGKNGDRARRCGSAARDARPELDRDSEPRRSRTGISRIVVSPNGVSSYHGQTSTLFEENQPERAPAGDARPRMPDDWVEKGLVAEAAKQRASIPLPSPCSISGRAG